MRPGPYTPKWGFFEGRQKSPDNSKKLVRTEGALSHTRAAMVGSQLGRTAPPPGPPLGGTAFRGSSMQL